ncbi:MAG TPA: FKBP-type peptidyl-prolyl cis-trans isomerase [Fimbriimonadaceae bacterium]|nr:FKBP-type peptidyl-prolyl cis-trans isomerase [Fimbriimonadaceae bacterium]
MVSFALALVMFQTKPMPRTVPLIVTAVQPGYGDPVLDEARITVEFVAKTAQGKVVADTARRGMPFTFLLGQDNVSPIWERAVSGLNVGGSRVLAMPASSAGLRLAGDPDLVVTVRVTKVAPL